MREFIKKTFVIALVPALCVVLATGCGQKNEENTGTKTGNEASPDTATHTIDEQVVEGLTFSDAVIQYQNNESSFKVKVTNNTDSAIVVDRIVMHLKDEDNNSLFDLVGTIGESIEPGSSRTIGSSYAGDLSETVNVEYEVIKG